MATHNNAAAGQQPPLEAWRNSAAKALILQDLQNGTITRIMHADLVFDNYHNRPEFLQVLRGQDRELFRDRFKVLKRAVYPPIPVDQLVARDTANLAHDRQLFPEQTHLPNGERSWH